MMAMVYATLMLMCLAADPPGQQWQKLADLRFGTFEAAASMVDDRIVVTGGIGQAGETLAWTQVYNPQANRWTAPVKLGVGRCSHAQVTLPDGRVLIVGGETGQVPGSLKPLGSAELIDLNAQEATAAPDLQWTMTGPTAHLLADGRAIIIGGRSAAVFDGASNTWSRFIRLRQSRTNHASLLMADGRVLVAGGTGRDSLELIDVEAGLSQRLSARMDKPMDDLALAPLDAGRAWLLGGQDTRTGRTTDQTWIIDVRDPRRTVIEEGPRLGIEGGMADHAVAVLKNWVFIVGGESETEAGDRELVKARILGRATSQIWSLPDLATPHDDATALPWRNGVVVIGGYYRQATGFGKLKMPTASRTVETLQLSAARVNETR